MTDNGWISLPMDVRDDTSVTEAVERIHREAGRLDVVVNNAGIGIAGAVEDTSIEEAMDLLQTNFLGALRVCRAVLPHLRAQGGGTIVNISSIGGRIGLPFQGLYSASKFALWGLSEALRIEVRPFGIRVILVEPGDFYTGFTARRRLVASANPAYQGRFERALQRVEADEKAGGDPAAVARLVLKVVQLPNPRLRYTVGNPAQRLVAHARGVVPGHLLESGVTRYYRVR